MVHLFCGLLGPARVSSFDLTSLSANVIVTLGIMPFSGIMSGSIPRAIIPPPGQTPGHLTFLKMPDQIPRYMGRFLGQMPHWLGLKSHRVGFFFFFVFASSIYIKINEIDTFINLKQFVIKDNA